MSDKAQIKRQSRIRRHTRVRRKVRGTTERPRLAVFRSNKHIYAQVIDDERGVTLAQASTLDESLKGTATGNIGAASAVGTLVANRAKDAGVASVVLDRGGFRYQGRVAAVAEAAREAGLEL